MPNDTERTPGTVSVSTRTPPGRTVRRTVPSARSVAPEVGGLGTRARGLDDRRQADLATAVDLGDLDLELLADRQHVLDLVDPLAASELLELADVQQAVPARRQRHERAEARGLDDRAE